LDNELARVPISQLSENKLLKAEGSVAREQPLTIILNNKELVTLLCTPVEIDYLAIGFLFSEGFINSKNDINEVLVDDDKGVVRIGAKNIGDIDTDTLHKRVITSGCGRGASFYNLADLQSTSKIESETKLYTETVIQVALEFQHRSKVYQATHGVHSAALCEGKNILVFHEDVGRHNAVDKIVGECLMKDIETAHRVLISSGRISSEILLKVAHINIPILLSMSAPTDMAVKLANQLGITVVGLIKARKMTIFSNAWRIENGGGN
jgi:FdhD protein